MPKYLPSKFLFLWLLAGCTAYSAAAQPPDTSNQTDAAGRKQGLWVKVHPTTGKVAYRATFKDNKPVGKTERYYEDGRLQAEIIHGPKEYDRARLYHPNGGLMAKGNYLKQERDSVWVFYDEQGKVRSEETYATGKRNGLSRLYYPNGSVAERVMYKNDLRNGSWEKYHENGNPKLVGTVVNDLYYEGKYAEYHTNGTKRLEGNYVEGRRESSWYQYNEDGSIRIIYVYRADRVTDEYPKNGVFEEYWPNDLLRSSTTWKDGKMHGPFKEYYLQGEWRTEEAKDEFGNVYPVQRLYGVQVMREGKYIEGELHGEVVHYHTNGKVSKRETWERGKLLR